MKIEQVTFNFNKELLERLRELARHNEISVDELIERLLQVALQQVRLPGQI